MNIYEILSKEKELSVHIVFHHSLFFIDIKNKDLEIISQLFPKNHQLAGPKRCMTLSWSPNSI